MAGPTISHEFRGKSDEVDFLKGEGGFFAVSLTLSLDNVKTLQKNLRECLKNANKYNRNEIEIIAHWGERTKGAGDKKGGFRLGMKVKQQAPNQLQ